MRGEREDVDADWGVGGESLRCFGCSYDLRGIPLIGVCPECGVTVAHSVLGINDPNWLDRLAAATEFGGTGRISILIGLVSIIVSTGLAFSFSIGTLISMLLLALGLWVFLTGLLCAWHITAKPPAGVISNNTNRLRIIARAFVWPAAGGTLIATINFCLGNEGPVGTVGTLMLCPMGPLGMIGGACYGFYLRQLARRLHLQPLSMNVTFYGLLFVLASVLAVMEFVQLTASGANIGLMLFGGGLICEVVFGLVLLLIPLGLTHQFSQKQKRAHRVQDAYRRRKALLEDGAVI